MGWDTKISWCESTWNPVMGCTPVSEGCANCYARAMMQRHAGHPAWPPSPDAVTLYHGRLNQPLHWRKPRRIFVCSMADLFHEEVPADFIDVVLYVIGACPQHTFIVLTKRPQNLETKLYRPPESTLEAGEYYPNLWIGVTAENQQRADERVPLLLRVPAAVHWVNVEPMLGPVDLSPWLRELDWVVCGAESGPKRRPFDVQWARDLRDQCVAAGVPFFFKQGSAARPGSNALLDGQEWMQFPEGGYFERRE